MAVGGQDSPQQQAASSILQQLRRSALSPADAVDASGFRLRAGPATVYLQEGKLVATTPIAGRPLELVFLGKGWFELDPGDDIERAQLELFTDAQVLHEELDWAVLVVAADQAVDTAFAKDRVTVSTDERRQAEAALEEWQGSSERKILDVEGRLLADALGDPLAAGFFCGFLHGRQLGTFLYSVDPLADEQIILGQMLKPELDRQERRRVKSQLSHAQRQGKLIGVELEDFGHWVTWVCSTLRSPDGRAVPGTHGLDPIHYSHDLSISHSDPELRATTRITLQSTVAGLRTATLALHPDVVARAVRDAAGKPLAFLRTYGEITVALTETPEPGSQLVLEVEYEARPFDLKGGRFSLRQPLGWQPRVHEVDRATFDARVSYPRGLDLMGNGRIVGSGETEAGGLWQQRALDVPCTGFSFELGEFEVLRQASGHVDIMVAVDRQGRKISEDLAKDLIVTIEDSLGYFEEIFGPYPLDQLVVVTSPRVFSQGLLGFVTLSTASLGELGEWGALLGMEDRRTIIAHEIAHQWWGNLVGWQSYRDQWISEAMANYSALLYSRHRLQGMGETVWRGPTSGWTRWLLSTTSSGRPVESLGPVVLGTRLKDAFGRRAYEAIVYKKGAIILDTLARLLESEGKLLEVLRGVVEAAAFKAISTDTFLELVERGSGMKLDWFARQYVYGTGLPEVFYSWQAEHAEDGSWAAVGVCRQHSPYYDRYRVERLADGRLDVRRRAVRLLDLQDSMLVVPFELGVQTPGGSDADAADTVSHWQVLSGHLGIKGTETRFRIPSQSRPEVLLLDRQREVFGRFFCETCWPKQSKLSHGLDLEAAGRYDEAEAMLREALVAPMVAMPEHWREPADDLQWRERTLGVQARLHLARLLLDREHLAEAAAEVEQAKQLMTRGDRWQFEKLLAALETRILLARSPAVPAAQVLQVIDEALRERRYSRSGEAYALLAIAAFQAGDKRTLQAALAEAEGREVDMTVLREAMAGGRAP